MRAELEVMVSAAKEAGAAFLKDFAALQAADHGIEDVKAFTGEADQREGLTLQAALMAAAPSYGIFVEGLEERAGEGATRWIVDPMDGTANFERGMAHWAVTIALEEKGEIVASVVFDPVKDELFTASKGEGAWLNGTQGLATSGKAALADGFMATGMPMAGSAMMGPSLATFGNVLNACSGVRQWGAAALDLAYVGAGRLDGYWNTRLKLWHYVAGMLVVTEAGGSVAPVEPELGLGAGGLVGICSAQMQADFAKVTG